MGIGIEGAALNLALALFCGALIGSERQVRQRMAGLRTNALVALGAATYVVFSQLFPDEVSPTRVAAQVVSGIGFLGAGIIFRHGFTVHGLNTAATLWCSAAVGLIAGAGYPAFAILATGLVVFVNLGLRPQVKWLKRKTRAGIPLLLEYRVIVDCETEKESDLRAQALQLLSGQGVQITGFEKCDSVRSGTERLSVSISVVEKNEDEMNSLIAPLMLAPGVVAIAWESSVEE